MKLPAGHARRLFLGFTCSIMLLVVFAVLVAHNTEAESSGKSENTAVAPALAISIPTAKPEETISFYKDLGFKTAPGLAGNLDTVCMEKNGTPYKLEICHNKFSEVGPLVGGVSGMSFQVADLADQIVQLKAKGFSISEALAAQGKSSFASLEDPNGIAIKLFEK